MNGHCKAKEKLQIGVKSASVKRSHLHWLTPAITADKVEVENLLFEVNFSLH